MRRNVGHLAPNRETTRPVASGDERTWPAFKSLFFLRDYASGTHFLVDTGAEVSVIPPSRSEHHRNKDSKLILQAVNGSSITTFGTRSLTLNLGLHRTFRWIFVIADVQNPILGADFLRNFGLLMDMKHTRL